MSFREHATLYVYGPSGDALIRGNKIPPEVHIPREGETLRTTDHTDETPQTVPFAKESVRVSRVESEFRMSENIGRGQSWHQLIYIHTEHTDDNTTTEDHNE